MSTRDEIAAAVALHAEWKVRLRQAFESDVGLRSAGFALDKISDDDACPLGRWLYGPTITEATRAGAHYRRVRDLHQRFHVAAAEVIMLAAAGNRDAADDALDGSFGELSRQLAAALDEWIRSPESA
jgi:hypothetical protein